jgi:galactonate dehydratase
MACWDILGKSLDVPVWRLLGGKCRDKIRAYANGWYQVERSPEAIASRARDVVRTGYTALKIDPFGAGSYEMTESEKASSVEIVAAVREAIGPETDLFIEMHGRFAAHTAIEMCHRLAPIGLVGLKSRFRRRTSTRWPQCSVQSRPGNTCRRGRASVHAISLSGSLSRARSGHHSADVCHAGGLAETRKIAAMAEAHYIPVAPHNACSPVGTMASLHVAACTPNFKIQETFDDMVEPWVREAIIGRPEVRDGYFSLPHAPGLGVDLNEAVIRAHPRRKVS